MIACRIEVTKKTAVPEKQQPARLAQAVVPIPHMFIDDKAMSASGYGSKPANFGIGAPFESNLGK